MKSVFFLPPDYVLIIKREGISGMNKILLVEDDTDILETNKKYLEYEGYEIITSKTSEDAYESVLKSDPDLMVLDIILPDGNGIDLGKKIRAVSHAPILFLTSDGKIQTVVSAFEAGGDDYLVKPYDMEELTVRIKALLKRTKEQTPMIREYPPLEMDVDAHIAYIDGNDLLLTQKEFQMLVQLIKNAGEPVSTAFLFEKVWGDMNAVNNHTVQVHISSIRKKIAEYISNETIQILSVRNKGYSFSYTNQE